MKDPQKNKYAIKLSLIAVIIIVLHSLIFNGFWRTWKYDETQFKHDVDNYYSYLPGAFIHQDLTFSYPHTYWLTTAPNGAKVQKGTCGMAIMYLPFFVIGHKIAFNTNVAQNGYSGPYSEMVHYGTIFYSLLGFFFLQRALSKYFTDGVVAVTLLCVFFGTNLFYYTVGEGEMTHSYLFCLFSILIWLIIKWHEAFKWKHTVLIGLIMGLISLIRPTESIICLVFVLYDVTSFRSLQQKIRLLLKKWPHLVVMALCAVLMILPQLIYWKWLTGDFFYFSYGSNERFFWGEPMFGKVLFSWRKGMLIYTPILIFALAGMFFGKRYVPRLNFGFKFYLLINLYIISAWWCWWYGGSFGMRTMVQSYCFLSFFFAAFLDKVFVLEWKSRFNLLQVSAKYLMVVALCCLVSLNLIQTYQYNKGMIHHDSMTKQAYWITFCRFEHTGQDGAKYWNSLKEIDYAKAQNGDRDQ